MGYSRLRWVTAGYDGLQQVTMGYSRLRWVTEGYNRLQQVTVGLIYQVARYERDYTTTTTATGKYFFMILQTKITRTNPAIQTVPGD